MENVLKSTKYANCSPTKLSPQKTRKPFFNPEVSKEENQDLSEICQSKGMRILQWLSSKGIKKCDPNQLFQNLRENQRRKIVQQRQNVKPLTTENPLMMRRMSKKLTIKL